MKIFLFFVFVFAILFTEMIYQSLEKQLPVKEEKKVLDLLDKLLKQDKITQEKLDQIKALIMLK